MTIQPPTDITKIEALISKKANEALIYALVGAMGLSAVVFCPLAIVYASQAIKLIDQHQLGEKYRSNAKAAKAIAIIFTILYTITIALYFLTILMFRD